MSLVVSQSPHLKVKTTAQAIYFWVIIALLPACFAGVYFFGFYSLLVILSSVVSALICDFVCQKLSGHDLAVNGSAIITGLLLAMVIPPAVPLWLPAIGSAFAIFIAKYCFGPGNAVFNPALVARTFLAISFPLLMTTYVAVDGLAAASPGGFGQIDGITGATPLTVAKYQGYDSLLAQYGSKQDLLWNMFIGKRPGALGETSIICILAGGIFLIIMRIIDWRIPVVYILTSGLASFVFGIDVVFSLLAGGLMLGAFFMATDYVTTPLTRNGKLIFAFGCGFLTVVLRLYSGYPEAVAFSILLMNAASPLIDRITKPRPWGY
jgi:electron transport complex protein RnfD